MKPQYTLERTITVNGVETLAQVSVYCEQDDIDLDDVIGDAEDRPAIERKLERGDLMIAVIRVEAEALGLSDFSCIGGVCIESPSDVTDTVSDYDMIHTACMYLEATILKQIETLKPFIK